MYITYTATVTDVCFVEQGVCDSDVRVVGSIQERERVVGARRGNDGSSRRRVDSASSVEEGETEDAVEWVGGMSTHGVGGRGGTERWHISWLHAHHLSEMNIMQAVVTE